MYQIHLPAETLLTFLLSQFFLGQISLFQHQPGNSLHLSLLLLQEVKGKGEREKYTQLNAEFQGIARRDKKALLNEQSKETEENN